MNWYINPAILFKPGGVHNVWFVNYKWSYDGATSFLTLLVLYQLIFLLPYITSASTKNKPILPIRRAVSSRRINIKMNPYKIAHAHEEHVKTVIADMEKNTIQRNCAPPWASSATSIFARLQSSAGPASFRRELPEIPGK